MKFSLLLHSNMVFHFLCLVGLYAGGYRKGKLMENKKIDSKKMIPMGALRIVEKDGSMMVAEQAFKCSDDGTIEWRKVDLGDFNGRIREIG